MKTILLLLGISVFYPLIISAQTTVYSSDFNTNNNSNYTTSGQIGTQSWYVERSGDDWGARIDNGRLENTNDVGATANADGWVFGYCGTTSFSSPYSAVLNNIPDKVTWYLNLRQIRTDPAGFGSGYYGVAFVLCASSQTLRTDGDGYAIVLGQSGSTDPIRLIKFTSGFDGTLTDLITSNTSGLTDFGNDYLSIKVTYNPSSSQWELFLRNDGSSAFTDPTTGTLTSQGTATDNTYTGISLDYAGGYWQGSTASSQTAFFDNFTVQIVSYLTLSTSTLTNFNYIYGSGPSTSQSYNISGTGLTPASGDLTITGSTNYEVSTDNINFGGSKTISYTGSALSSTPVYVRLKSGLSMGNYNSETISNSGGGATTKNVSCSGQVLKPEPSDHVTDFLALESGLNTILICWTAVDGTQAPDGFLIKASDVGYGSITAPSDGSTESDATFIKNAIYDQGTIEFSGLSSATKHYFRIWPYTNNGTNINYKTGGTIPEDTVSTATSGSFYFRSKNSGNWGDLSTWESSTDLNNWSNATFLPGSLNNVNILNGHAVTLNGFKYRCKELDIDAGGKLYTNETTLTTPKYLHIYGSIINDGTIGNGTTNDRISFNLNASANISGLGTFTANRIRKNGGGNTSHTISQAIELRYSGVAIYNNAASSNSFNVTVDQSSTINCINGGYSLKSNDQLLVYGTLKLNNTMSNSAGNSGITIKSSSSGTGNLIHSTQNVAGTVERYITGNATNEPYHFVSSPVKDAPFSSLWTSGDKNVFWYDESVNNSSVDQGWTRISSGNLTNGRGYSIVGNYNNRTLSFQGNLMVPADISSQIAVSFTSSGTTSSDGWNLVGNPYPCALDPVEFINDNSSVLETGYQAVYYWDNPDGDRARADYAVYGTGGGVIGGSNTAPEQYIPVGQGFFVKVKSGSTNISLTSDQRIENIGAQYWTPDFDKPVKIWFAVKGPDKLRNQAMICFLNDASYNLDAADVIKLRGNPDIALYSLINGYNEQFIIQSFPLQDLSTEQEILIPVGVHAGYDGFYSFLIDSLLNFEDYQVILEDKIAKSFQKIDTKSTYQVFLTSGEYNQRFVLHISNRNISTKTDALKSTNMFYYNNTLYITGANKASMLEIVNEMGQSVKLSLLDNLGTVQVSLNDLNSGIYLAKIYSENQVPVVKVVIVN